MSSLIKSIFLIHTVLFIIILSPGCFYDVEEDLYPDTGCDTSDVTYSGTVLPLLQTNCYGCHSAAAQTGGVILEGYDKVLVHVNSGALLGAIKRDPGFAPMPQDQPQLPACEIEKVEAWIDNGALDD